MLANLTLLLTLAADGGAGLQAGLSAAAQQPVGARTPSTEGRDAAPVGETPLTGRWAMLQVLSNRAEVPFVGDAVANTRVVLLLDLAERPLSPAERRRRAGPALGADTVLEGGGQACLLDIDAKPRIVRPVLPETFRDAVGPQPFKAYVARVGARTRVRGVRQRSLLGAELKRPWTDPMPAPGSTAIVDTDRDGKPGMTMRVEGLFDIEFYLAQRQWTQLSGETQNEDVVAGRLRHHSEQVLLGADSFLLQALPAMKADPRTSRFEMRRVDPAASCADAVKLLLPGAPLPRPTPSARPPLERSASR